MRQRMITKQSIRSHLATNGFASVYIHHSGRCVPVAAGLVWCRTVDNSVIRFFYAESPQRASTGGAGGAQTKRRMEGRIISELFINEQIRDKEVRVIGEDGEQLGIMPVRDALKLAEEAGVDLVKIAPTAKPPVCRIVDYGKFKYEQTRKEKEAKKKQKTVEIKEIRLSPNIDTNDLNTKINAARKFIGKGDRVKITLRFRGREMAHMNHSKHILDDFAEAVADIAVVDKAPKVEGRTMTMFLAEKR